MLTTISAVMSASKRREVSGAPHAGRGCDVGHPLRSALHARRFATLFPGNKVHNCKSLVQSSLHVDLYNTFDVTPLKF